MLIFIPFDKNSSNTFQLQIRSNKLSKFRISLTGICQLHNTYHLLRVITVCLQAELGESEEYVAAAAQLAEAEEQLKIE